MKTKLFSIIALALCFYTQGQTVACKEGDTIRATGDGPFSWYLVSPSGLVCSGRSESECSAEPKCDWLGGSFCASGYTDTVTNACDIETNVDDCRAIPNCGWFEGQYCKLSYETEHTLIESTDFVIIPSGITDVIIRDAGLNQSSLTISSIADCIYPCDTSFNTITVSACNEYTVPSGNSVYTESGIYQDIIPNSVGCDSVITIELTITTSYHTMSFTACNEYTVPSGDETYSVAGVYKDTIPNAVGCDSIITINLTFNTPNTGVNASGTTLTAVETGATYQWINCLTDNLVNEANSNVFTAEKDGEYALVVTKNSCTDTSDCYFAGTNFSMDFGIANTNNFANVGYTLNTVGGFTVEYDFYMNRLKDVNPGLSTGTCGGDPQPIDFNVDGSGDVIIRVGGCADVMSSSLATLSAERWYHIVMAYDTSNFMTYLYIDGEKADSINKSLSGILSSSIDIGAGQTSADARFDNIRFWSITRSPEEIKMHMASCLSGDEPGLDIYYNMDQRDPYDLYDQATGNGAQNAFIASTVSWTSGVQRKEVSSLEVILCASEYTSPSGKILTTSGTYYDTLSSLAGCDSIITIHLTIGSPSSNSVDVTSCGTYLWNGSNYTESGIYKDTLLSVAGCDSIVTLNLTVQNFEVIFVQHSDTTAGSALTLINRSKGTNMTYLWEFGDGQTSSSASPTHTYADSGTYNLCLTGTDEQNCSDQYCSNITLIDDGVESRGNSQESREGTFSINVIDSTFNNDLVLSGDPMIELEHFSTIYPNPNMGSFQLDLSRSGTVFISDLIGNEVYSKKLSEGNHVIDLRNQKSGEYLIIFDDGVIQKTNRIVIQR